MNPTVRVVGLGLILAGGGRFTYDRLREFSQIDPFASFRSPKGGVEPNLPAIVLENVEMRDYRSGKLVARATAGRIDVGRDRRSFNLTDIRDGIAPSKNGPQRFTAKRAFYDGYSRTLTVTEKGTLTNRDVSLRADRLVYDDARKTVRVTTPIKGTVKGGDAQADMMSMDLDKGTYRISNPNWRGNPNAVGVAGIPQNSKIWTIRADLQEHTSADTTEYTNGSAADDEILVKAPKIVHDEPTDVITATGRCFYYSAKANVVADKIVVYRKEHRAVLTGNVILLSKPKDESTASYVPKEEKIPGRPDAKIDAMDRPTLTHGPTAEEKDMDKQLRDGKTIRRFPLLIGADKVIYWYQKGERHALVSGNPQARQEIGGGRWRHVWTWEADYDGEKESLTARSPEGKREARMKNSKGDDLLAREFFLHTKEGDDYFRSKDLDGDIVGDKEDEEGGSDKPLPPVRVGGKAETGSPAQGPAAPPQKPRR